MHGVWCGPRDQLLGNTEAPLIRLITIRHYKGERERERERGEMRVAFRFIS